MLLLGVQNDPIVGNEGVAAVAATIINAGAANRRVMWQGVGHGASIYSTVRAAAGAGVPRHRQAARDRHVLPRLACRPRRPVYGALVAVPDTLLSAFRPRTSPPNAATVLRSVLWPVAILSIIHRSYVLATNGYITDDFGPVYRAVVNFKLGLDIYNEHFDQVDPHYLYPPGGTLLLAPFGYLPVDASRYWFITFNTIAILLAAYFLLRLFKFSLASVAAPALLLAMFCTESVTSTLVFTNINGCILLGEVLFFRWLLDGKVNHQWLAGVAIGLTLVVKPSLAPLLLLPLLNRQWRALVPAFGVPLLFNAAAWPLVSDPMGFVRNTVPYIFSVRDYFNSSIQGNGIYYGLPMWLILLLRIVFLAARGRQPVAAVPLLPRARPAVLDADVLRRAADRDVPGDCRWARATTR